ncbi:MAG: hypothetical protein ACREQ7_06775 [Candidatus Binatia bacterium]
MSQGRLVSDWDDYLARLREDAHLLVAWGYTDTRDKLQKARDECDITSLLADAMDRRINDPRTPERFTLYSVHNERPISPTGELGKERPKLDIQIERCGVRPKPHYTFEAKRLRDDDKATVSDSLAHYLGDEGVGRFVADRYEAESAEAAMLACIQAHDAEVWLGHVARAFAEDVTSGRNRLKIVEQLRRCHIIAELPDEASTIHRRVRGSAIRLLHIFLCCT